MLFYGLEDWLPFTSECLCLRNKSFVVPLTTCDSVSQCSPLVHFIVSYVKFYNIFLLSCFRSTCLFCDLVPFCDAIYLCLFSVVALRQEGPPGTQLTWSCVRLLQRTCCLYASFDPKIQSTILFRFICLFSTLMLYIIFRLFV